MPTRLASILALLVFTACLIEGCFEVGNTFTTTVSRALAAMAGTFFVGLILGWMAQRMIEENLKPVEKPASEIKELKDKIPVKGR